MPNSKLVSLGMSPFRTALFVMAMPFAIAVFLIGLGDFAMSAVLSGQPSLSTVPGKAYAMMGLGAAAIATVSRSTRSCW